MPWSCPCSHCSSKREAFRAHIVKHNGLPIISANVHIPRRTQLIQAIEYIQTTLTHCNYVDQPTLERKLDELTTELSTLGAN